MNLKQLLEDWIGADESRYLDTSLENETHARNELKAELRASLPDLLAKIEQHVLEARRNELEYVDPAATVTYASGGIVSDMTVGDRISELDALLNTKEAEK